MKNLETLIDDGGSISVAVLAPIGCVAAATDGSNCLAMLVRRDGQRNSQQNRDCLVHDIKKLSNNGYRKPNLPSL